MKIPMGVRFEPPAALALRLGGCVFAALVLLPIAAAAQSGLSRAEAAQMYTAAGFPIRDDEPVNRCGQPARPRVTFVDINGDRRPEALFIDANAACYAPDGRYFAVLRRSSSGWQLVAGGTGTIEALQTRTAGWLDMRIAEAGCSRQFTFDGERYAPASSCGSAAPAAKAPPARASAEKTATPNAASPPPAAGKPSPAVGKLSAADEAAVFKAAGFKKRGGQWHSDCDDPGTQTYTPGAIDQVADLNGDGRPDVVLTEGGTYCYGNTGTGYWLLSRRADGGWQLMDQNTGIPEFLATRGVDGWPDISVGGPGFCFPVERWNGRQYKLQRWQYEGKPCKPPR